MIKTFVKKPVKVQAVQWTGDNYGEIACFVGHVRSVYHLNDEYTIIETFEGDHYLRNGEIYSCDPDIFEKTYAEVIYD